MTFYANIPFGRAFSIMLAWAADGSRTRIVRLENGYYMVCKLESWTYKHL